MFHLSLSLSLYLYFNNLCVLCVKRSSSSLNYLLLNDNKFTGTLPATITNLTELVGLSLQGNNSDMFNVMV